MRIQFISRGTPSSLLDSGEKERERADISLFGFYGEVVCYEKELHGDTRFFESAARYSKRTQSVVVCGCVTDTKGNRRKSAVVAENGRLVGISDALHAVDGGFSSGAALRVYETQVGRMGVAVADDLRFPEVFQALAACGSDFIVCPFDALEGIQSVLLRANAYCYGVPVYFCAEGYCMIADVTGEIVFASPQSPVSTRFSPRKEYHLVETRRRGFYQIRT